MSDIQNEPSWWQASDGKWYPPPAGQPPPPPPPGAVAGQPIVVGQEERSRTPMLLGLFCGIPLLLMITVGLLAALWSGVSDGNSTGDESAVGDCEGPRDTEDTRSLCLYPERPDRQEEDHEAEVGQSVRLSGYTATVTGSRTAPGLIGGSVLIAEVSVQNRDDEAQPFSQFDWRLQTPGGQVIDPWGLTEEDDDIGSGDLVNGGSVEGTVSFEVETAGDYFLIYKPDAFDAARGVWKVTVDGEGSTTSSDP